MAVDAIMLQESFLGADVELYRTQFKTKLSLVLRLVLRQKFCLVFQKLHLRKVILLLYVKYIESGGDAQTQQTFTNNEQLITDTEITFGTTLIEVGSPFAQLLPTPQQFKLDLLHTFKKVFTSLEVSS